jgi:cyclopropane fatty-acyl-phospholipid synthase-like methyltransferase
MELAVSEAAERNKAPILRIIRAELAGCTHVLEIGSGTGQHAVYFAANLPAITWQPTDTGDNLAALQDRIRQAAFSNLRAAIELDVRAHPWPIKAVDAIFSANTLHIMSWDAVTEFFRGVGTVLTHPGVLCVYGPFRYAGRFTTESNAVFDAYLRARDPQSGVRDFEAVDALAAVQGLQLVADHPMPANNQLLAWRTMPRDGK